MTMPIGRDSDGTWVATDIAERDAIGLREAARVNDRCRIPGNDAIYRALTVPGLDTSTWTAGDWTMASLTLSGNLDLDSDGATATIGNGGATAIVEIDAVTGSLYFTDAGTRRWEWRQDASNNMLLRRYNSSGVFQDNPVKVDPNGKMTLIDDLAMSKDSPQYTLGGGGGSPVDVIQKTAAGTGERKWRVGTSDAAGDKRIIHESTENLAAQHHNGASWDTCWFLNGSADFNVPNQLLVANALATDAHANYNNVIIGDGAATARGLTFYIASGTYGGLAWNDGNNTNDGVIEYNGVGFRLRANGANRLTIDGSGITPLAGQDLRLGITSTEGWNSLALTERADHVGAPTATRGEIWLRDDQLLIFTDESGTDNVIAFV